MSKFLKNMAIVSLAVGMLVNFVACEEEVVDSATVPEIYEMVSEAYSVINKETKCTKITEELQKIKSDESHREACVQYNDALKKAEDANPNEPYKHLAMNQTNSGFYTAVYVHATNLSKELKDCEGEEHAQSAARETFRSLFDGCHEFWEAAEAIESIRAY